MVLTQRLLFVTQLALWLLLQSAWLPLTQALFAVLLLAKAYQLRDNSGTVLSVKTANVIALGGIACFVLLVNELGVVHLMMHFLFFAALLRLLSLRTLRHDADQLFLVHYLLIACCFILQQQLWFSVLVVTVGALNFLAHWLWSGQQHKLVLPVKPLLISVLMAVVLLLVAPRLSPFWQVPSPKVAQSGLASVMSANDIDELLSSDELAFRVSFSEPEHIIGKPLYFRSRVYHQFDGQQWHSPRYPKPHQFQSSLPRTRYQIIAEPHQQVWLFNLGTAITASSDLQVNHYGLLMRNQPLTQRIAYEVESIDIVAKTEPSVQPFLQLPPDRNPRLVALGQQSIVHDDTVDQIVRRFTQLIADGGYRYSLTPGAMTSIDAVDEFMFARKRGFCVHYAQAATVFLRAAGVPARLVGGYVGGQWQAGDSYLRIRQANAHAWVEYLDENQWKRYDPTLFVFPELASAQAQVQQLGLLRQLGGDFWSPGHFGGMLIQLAQDLDYYWASRVLSFEQADQQHLQQRLQQWLIANWRWVIALVSLILACIPTLLWYLAWRQQPLPYRVLGQRLLSHKRPEESVDAYLRRLELQQPQASTAIASLRQRYHSVAYQTPARNDWTLRLAAARVAFRLN